MTSETRVQHTPGPWRLDDDVLNIDGNDEIVIRLEAVNPSTTDSWGRQTIGWLDGTPLDDEEQQANARLIAAAPSMLSILQTVYARTDNEWLRHEAASGIRAALGDEAYGEWFAHARR